MTVWIVDEKCTGCKACVKVCPYGGVDVDGKLAKLNDKCTHCGACVDSCKFDAIKTDMIKKEVDLSAFSGVWVFAEQRGGEISRVARELLGSTSLASP
jgi:electron transfer flavoprotein alpha subunit